jgi:ribA/ribD-fused uncharacterized protein
MTICEYCNCYFTPFRADQIACSRTHHALAMQNRAIQNHVTQNNSLQNHSIQNLHDIKNCVHCNCQFIPFRTDQIACCRLHHDSAKQNIHISNNNNNNNNQQKINNANIINFYNKNEPYYEFTNFYPAPIVVDGYYHATSEHYFQSQKFRDDFKKFNAIRTANSPREAFDVARSFGMPLTLNWLIERDNVMRKALYEKFTQHPKLKNLLKSTGNAKLVEHTANDNYWGDGGNGSGQNRLGELLMELRNNL